MKGLSMPEDIGWTLVFILVLEIFVIILTLLWIEISLPGFNTGPVAYSVEFVQLYSKPFMLAEVLAHTKFDDRQLLEQAIEVSAVNSLEGAGATRLPVTVASFVDTYKFRNYYISINRDNKEIVNIQSTQSKCGDNLDGWCVFPISGIGCDVGRVEISQGTNECTSKLQLCCKEDARTYASTVGAQKGIAVVSCGPNQEGVCSTGIKPTWAIFSNPTECTQARVNLGNRPECVNANANGGNTLVCCAPLTEETLTPEGKTTKSTTPLLFKDRFGTLEVTAK